MEMARIGCSLNSGILTIKWSTIKFVFSNARRASIKKFPLTCTQMIPTFQNISSSAIFFFHGLHLFSLFFCLQAASDAIKSLLLGVRSILLQQAEELDLQRKAEKLEKKLQKESSSLDEMEKKLEPGSSAENPTLELGPNHPLSLKRAKIEALKKRVDDEKAKSANSVEVTKAMALNHLKNGLPRVFRALMEFTNACTRAFEALNNRGEQVDTHADESRVLPA